MTNKQKLELTWIGKNNPEYDIANIEPRILEERTDLSYGDPNTENVIIHGDNLLALKALLPEYEGRIKCIYIDPPYNTGHAFEHYDDSVEHSTWLSLMKPRLELLRILMREDGSIYISIDDAEAHYLKILCDEVFGRNNFLATVIWQHSLQSKGYNEKYSLHHNYFLCYRKSDAFQLQSLERTEEHNKNYSNPDNDPRGPWRPGDVRNSLVRPNLMYDITSPSGKIIKHPPNGWRFSKATFEKELSEGKIIFSKDEDRIIRKIYLADQSGRVPETIWFGEDVGTTREANGEIKILFKDDVFGTPKPERLIQRVLTLASSPNDIVLDSFLGSGTTAAVAHKMGRKYIGIEMGNHAYTHVQVRLKKVVDGNDGLKLSEILEWKGGGGFKFYELAPSFIVVDEFGNPVIDAYYNDAKLIRAMCKLTGYAFAPSQTEYWKQGKGQGNNHIYITTQMLSVAMVQQIASHLMPNETLLICPKKYEPGCKEVDSRITIKKIPQSVLKACQFGRKEYLLPIKENAMEEVDDEDLPEAQE